MKTTFCTLFLIMSAFTCLSAQEGYTVKNDSLNSSVLKQNRKISIFLPERYEKNDSKYPVIYVLDAEGRDQHTVPTARFLFLNNKMPEAIIVGVFNVDREHDFLPDSSKNAPTGGGAGNFVKFFRSELIPYIDKNFRTEHYNVLIGHSYGGVFAMHTLLTDPDLFDAYIAVDPSFWYKNQMQVKSAQTEFTKSKNWDKSIFITGREGEGMKEMGIIPMEKLLKNSAPKELNWKIAAYSEEDHGSVTFKSVYDGLRFIFDSGSDFKVYPESGIIPKGSSAFALIENKNSSLRYTLDGREPDQNSPVCKDKIIINKACTLKVKNISKKYNKSATVTRVFSEGEYLKGLQTVENLKPGLKYSFYEGVWDSVPDFNRLKVKTTGITENLDLKFVPKRDSFAVKFDGYLHITDKGMYYLWVTSDDGSKVYFNNQLLLINDGLHSADNPVVKALPLLPGYYPLSIQYFERTGNESVTLGYVTGTKKAEAIPIPKEMLYYPE